MEDGEKKMKSLDNMVENAREQVLKTEHLNTTYATLQLAIMRIKEEAKNLNYTDWYGMKELDGQHLLEVGEEEFVMVLFKAMLKRPATAEDTRIMLSAMHNDHSDRIDVIDAIQNSEEASQYEPITVTGLEQERKKLYRRRRIKAIPIIGYIIRWCKSIILLPRELSYMDDRISLLGKRTYDYEILRKNIQNVNDVLEQNHLSLQEKRLLDEKEQYRQKIIRQFYQFYEKTRNDIKGQSERECIGQCIRIIQSHFSMLEEKKLVLVDLENKNKKWKQILAKNGYHSIDATELKRIKKDRPSYWVEEQQNYLVSILQDQPMNSINVISAYQVIDSMDIIDRLELCREITRVLKPNGLLIMDASDAVPHNLLEAYIRFGGLKVKEHINEFNMIVAVKR